MLSYRCWRKPHIPGSKERVQKDFTSLHALLQKTLTNDHPQRIWNMDEKKFSLEHVSTKVCARKGDKNVPYRVGYSRESLTCSICVKAAGVAMPLMLIIQERPRTVFFLGTQQILQRRLFGLIRRMATWRMLWAKNDFATFS